MLGRTDASSDLELPNEIEFALSANIGLTCREDFERRCRKITLNYFEEDENSRRFSRPDLWEFVKENRGLILSAIHTLFQDWVDAGRPEGTTPFTSYPRWAAVVGGIMMHHELGDPCLPHAESTFGGDVKNRAMRSLFRICFDRDHDEWWSKKQMFNAITEEQNDGNDDLAWFGDLDRESESKKAKTKTGMALNEFDGRVLGGIRVTMDKSNANSGRHLVRFDKV